MVDKNFEEEDTFEAESEKITLGQLDKLKKGDKSTVDKTIFSGDDNRYVPQSQRKDEIAEEQKTEVEKDEGHVGPSGKVYHVSDQKADMKEEVDVDNEEDEDEDEE